MRRENKALERRKMKDLSKSQRDRKPYLAPPSNVRGPGRGRKEGGGKERGEGGEGGDSKHFLGNVFVCTVVHVFICSRFREVHQKTHANKMSSLTCIRNSTRGNDSLRNAEFTAGAIYMFKQRKRAHPRNLRELCGNKRGKAGKWMSRFC